MPKVSIVTDTISCLPPEIVKEYGIITVSPCIIINGKSYRDQVDMTNDEFWNQFDDMQSFSTAAVIPGDFVSAFKQAGKETNQIVCVLVSKALSATFQSAILAIKLLKEENSPLEIEVIDSRTGTGAQGFVVIEGARAAQAGKSKSEVIQVIQEMIPRVKWINSMETTKYLIKIGRAPKTLPVEVFAQLKPMIAMLNNTGLVEDAGVARTKEESFQKMVDMIGQNADIKKSLHVNIHYTNHIEDGYKLRDMIRARYNVVEMYLTPYSAVMCGSTGPCNAIAFYS
jgi:DegV family protein with EDD domain